MVDIHCHILPGIDDGPGDIQESIRMSEIAARDGITRIVATPHIKHKLLPFKEIKDKVEELNSRLTAKGIPVEVLQGADVNALMDVSLLEGLTINKTNYILIEFPHSHIPLNAREAVFTMVVNGYRPIISHPERNLSVMKNPDILTGLVDAGALVQVTAESLTGGFGPDMRQCAFYLLSKGVVDFLATDAHSSQWRRPVLSEGLKAAENVLGRESASLLVNANPEAVLAGRSIDD
jgi:protein-tyrosine phosphatase